MTISEKRKNLIQIITVAVLITFFFCFSFESFWRATINPYPIYLYIPSFDYLIFTVFFLLLIRFAFKQTFRESGFIWNRETAFFAVFCLFYLLIPVIYNVVFIKTTFDVWASPMNYIVPLANNLLLVGVMEELVFRGFIFNKMLKFVSNKRSFIIIVLISAGFFAAVHLPGMIMNFDGLQYFAEKLFLVFFMGVWTALYYFYTKNLTVCILLHGTHNCIVNFSPHGRLSYIFVWVFWAVAVLYLIVKIKNYKRYATLQNRPSRSG